AGGGHRRRAHRRREAGGRHPPRGARAGERRNVLPALTFTRPASGRERPSYIPPLKSANSTPCGSFSHEKRPTFGMSDGGTSCVAPMPLAVSVLESTSSTAK